MNAAMWYQQSLTEAERKDIVDKFAGSIRYGLAVSFASLSMDAKAAVEKEYSER
jgi:hypothetical protein